MILKIEVETIEECESVIKFIDSYKDKFKNSDIPEDLTSVIDTMGMATDKFRIDNSFDLIGPVACLSCGKRWLAIVSNKRPTIQCPKCKFDNNISYKEGG